MRQEGNIIYASEGKVLKYKHNDIYFGSEVILGTRIGNDNIYDTIEDFEEVDDIKREDEFINISEEENV